MTDFMKHVGTGSLSFCPSRDPTEQTSGQYTTERGRGHEK